MRSEQTETQKTDIGFFAVNHTVLLAEQERSEDELHMETIWGHVEGFSSALSEGEVQHIFRHDSLLKITWSTGWWKAASPGLWRKGLARGSSLRQWNHSLKKFTEHPEIVKYAIMINFEDGRSPSLFRQVLWPDRNEGASRKNYYLSCRKAGCDTTAWWKILCHTYKIKEKAVKEAAV